MAELFLEDCIHLLCRGSLLPQIPNNSWHYPIFWCCSALNISLCLFSSHSFCPYFWWVDIQTLALDFSLPTVSVSCLSSSCWDCCLFLVKFQTFIICSGFACRTVMWAFHGVKMFYRYEGLGPQLVMLLGRGVESFEHGHKWCTWATRDGPWRFHLPLVLPEHPVFLSGPPWLSSVSHHAFPGMKQSPAPSGAFYQYSVIVMREVTDTASNIKKRFICFSSKTIFRNIPLLNLFHLTCEPQISLHQYAINVLFTSPPTAVVYLMLLASCTLGQLSHKCSMTTCGLWWPYYTAKQLSL